MRVITKKHDLFYATSLKRETVNNLKSIIPKIKGITDFHENQNGSLHVEYDLMKINLQKIESIFKKYDVILNNSFLKRFKRGWIHFTEENEYSNMTTSHTCCNSDPSERL